MRPLIVSLALALISCVQQPERPSLDRQGSKGGDENSEGGGGGSSLGGNGGTGTPTSVGGASGSAGEGGSGGSGASGSGASGSGGSRDASTSARDSARAADASAGLDVAADFDGTFEKLKLVTANCVFCHNDPSKRVDLQDQGLYMRLVNVPAAHAPTGCMPRTLVVPKNPMGSLLYLKIAGKVPTGCGAPMPYKKPMLTPMEVKIVFDWIMAGAPEQ